MSQFTFARAMLATATFSIYFLVSHTISAGQPSKSLVDEIPLTKPVTPATRIETGFEFVAPAPFSGTEDAGKISIFSYSASIQHTFQISPDTGLILGSTFRQFWFPSQGGEAVIPDDAGSIAVSAGIRQKFLDDWTFTVLGSVGMYSAEWRASGADSINFDATATIGYAFSENLQAFAGVAVFPQFQIPVLPAVGVRWQINDQWNLNLVMPKPTIEFEFAPGWKVYGFGQLAGGRFRTATDFGSPSRSNLGNRWMSYLDIRAGGGLSWSPTPIITLRAETGSSVYREFEFDGAGFSVDAGPALFTSSSLSIRF